MRDDPANEFKITPTFIAKSYLAIARLQYRLQCSMINLNCCLCIMHSACMFRNMLPTCAHETNKSPRHT